MQRPNIPENVVFLPNERRAPAKPKTLLYNRGMLKQRTIKQLVRTTGVGLHSGTKVELTEVVLVNDGKTVKVGSPFVKGAKVTGEIVRQGKGPKIEAFNYKPKKNERKRWGHRQPQTHLKVTGIEAGK